MIFNNSLYENKIKKKINYKEEPREQEFIPLF